MNRGAYLVEVTHLVVIKSAEHSRHTHKHVVSAETTVTVTVCAGRCLLCLRCEGTCGVGAHLASDAIAVGRGVNR